MSTHVILSVQENNEAKFDSLALLNADLHKTDVGELLEDYPDAAFIRQDAAGHLSFFERDDDGAYADRVEVWGWFGLPEAQAIANRLISGSLILRLTIEGDEFEYLKIEPNSARTINPTITF